MIKQRVTAVLVLVTMICTFMMPTLTADAYYEKLDSINTYTFVDLRSTYFIGTNEYVYDGSCAYYAPNGHMYVPLNMLAEVLNCDVLYEEEIKKVSVYLHSIFFSQIVGDPHVMVNGVLYDDVAPYINENNEVMIPLDVYAVPAGFKISFEFPDWNPNGICILSLPTEITSLSRIYVNKQMQMVTVYGKTPYGHEYPVRNFMCSTGSKSSTTPNGTYRARPLSYGNGFGKWYYFQKVGVWVIYCTQITGNVCFHSTSFNKFNNVNSLYTPSYTNLGSPASAGCVRLTVQDAQFIWNNCANLPVTISNGYYDANLQDIKNKIIKNKPSVANYIKSVDYVVIK